MIFIINKGEFKMGRKIGRPRIDPERKRLPMSVAFDQDILERVDRIIDVMRMSRSCFTNIALEDKLKVDEQRLGIVI